MVGAADFGRGHFLQQRVTSPSAGGHTSSDPAGPAPWPLKASLWGTNLDLKEHPRSKLYLVEAGGSRV